MQHFRTILVRLQFINTGNQVHSVRSSGVGCTRNAADTSTRNKNQRNRAESCHSLHTRYREIRTVKYMKLHPLLVTERAQLRSCSQGLYSSKREVNCYNRVAKTKNRQRKRFALLRSRSYDLYLMKTDLHCYNRDARTKKFCSVKGKYML